MNAGVVIEAADRLAAAQTSGAACEPVSDLLGPSDIDLAYRVQRELTERRLAAGARIVGRKIGLTSAAVQQQIGVAQPDFGVLFEDMRYEDGAEIPIERLLQPKAEAEVAFLLAADLAGSIDAATVRAAVALAYPAIEIVDSRIRDWRIGITDTVADNASSGVFVVGAVGAPLDQVEPRDVVMWLHRGEELVSRGTGRDCLGDPLEALGWLARTAIEVGSPLRAGDLVLSGALGPMVPITGGDAFRAEIAPLGTVSVRFTERGAE